LDAATSAGSEDRDPRREEVGCIALSSPWYSDPDHTKQIHDHEVSRLFNKI
jgi:hypothetical protein